MSSSRNTLNPTGEVLLPVVFRSPNENIGSGALAYIVLVPCLTVALYAIVGGILFAILKPAGINEVLLGKLLAAVLLPIAFIVVIWFALSDYRRRAGARIEVHNECIVVASAFYENRFGNGDIENVRIVAERSTDACQLELTDGRRVHLLSEVATFEKLRPALEASLIPELADRIQAELLEGRTIEIGENKLRAFLRMIAGAIGLCLGLLFFYLLPLIPWMPGVQTGLQRIRRGWRGITAGFSLTFHSVTTTMLWGGLPIDLSTAVDLAIDNIGVVVRFENELKVKSSPFAGNYWVVSHWLVRQVN